MFEWTPEDESAAREGRALRKAHRINRPRKPHGINRTDVQRQKCDVFTKQSNKRSRI